MTRREQEVLTWAAVGKTDSEIGTILTLSEDTVDSYFRTAFRKLNANTRVMAVSKTISYGLIRP